MDKKNFGGLQDLEAFKPYEDFSQAAEAVVKTLYEKVPFDLWMVTKVAGNDWFVMAAENHGYDVGVGDVLNWSDSFCYRMVRGLGPNFTSDCARILDYSSAPINNKLKISAYVGVPIILGNDHLFGTLCGIHPEKWESNIEKHSTFIIHQGRLLSTLLTNYSEQQQKLAELQNEKYLSQIDDLTGVYNRKGWNKNLEIEEHRSDRDNTEISIIMIDMDNLKTINDSEGHDVGDMLLVRIAECIKNIVRPYDLVSRIGGDEFGILMANTSYQDTELLVERIRTKFNEQNIQASIGFAVRRNDESIKQLVTIADQNMYLDKKRRKEIKD